VVTVQSPSGPPGWRRSAELIGRRAECGVLDRLAGAVRSGRSAALVVHGEPGVGKTALLDYLAGRISDFQVIRAGGVQSEMELPFAGVHQLCVPLLAGLPHLPQPQREALRTALGMSTGPRPDRFLVGLAVLGLFADAGDRRPLLCLIDDEQWLDRTSAQVLGFVARRLGAESVGLVFATRVVTDDLRTVPDLVIRGLRSSDAAALLDTVLTGAVDTRVRDQIIAETHGNPLALLELPRSLTPPELAGGFGFPGAAALPESIEGSFRRRLSELPDAARSLLLIAATDPSGDPALVWRAAAVLGIDAAAAISLASTGLAEFGARVSFRHPLARSAVYRSAPPDERARIHRALAEATDPRSDPDRRAWHRAHGAAGPDEDVATELECSAGRARTRGGLAAAAAFLQRAAMLTVDPALRARRAITAAETEIQAGAFDPALALVALAEAGPLDELQRAQADLLRAQLAFVTNRGSDAPGLLLKAAVRLGPIDRDLSRATYLDALSAAIFTGRLAGPGGDVVRVARAAGAAPPQAGHRVADLLLDGTAATFNQGYAAGLPSLRLALARFGDGMSPEDELHWLWLACIAAMRLWDDHRWDLLSARHVELARELGSLSELPLALTLRAYLLLFRGDLGAAAIAAEEAQAAADATGTALAPYGLLGVAAFRGDERTVSDLHERAMSDVLRRGEGVGITFAEWARAVLYIGLGRYEDAVSAAENATAYAADPGSMILPLVELVEAAVRLGRPDLAADTYRGLAAMTGASGTDWALGLQLRCQALLTTTPSAEPLYLESIGHLGRTRMRVDLARARLLYGEWLRREGRNTDARDQLRVAHTALTEMGLSGFAERAARELRAAGGPVRRPTQAPQHSELTAQESRIARMASDGLSNPEIATRLFISSHTVQYHLHKVFTKLGVKSRGQLGSAMSRRDHA
jgi:DNA-binding CsgD family transcriptional regulator